MIGYVTLGLNSLLNPANTYTVAENAGAKLLGSGEDAGVMVPGNLVASVEWAKENPQSAARFLAVYLCAPRYLAPNLQHSLVGLSRSKMQRFIDGGAERGVHVKGFGADEPVGFTCVWTHWRYCGDAQALPNADRVFGGHCDMRSPLTLSCADCDAIGSLLRSAMADAAG